MGILTMTVEPQFKIKEVADMLRLSERTIRRWIKAGKLRAARFDGRGGTEYRISISAIKEMGFDVKDDAKPSEG